MRKYLVIAVGTLALAAMPAFAHKTYSHQKYFQHYEGTKTCLQCHKLAAKTFFHSQHYQWKAVASNIVDKDGRPITQKFGKINMINDYCTNPLPVWMHEYKNKNGKVVEDGCSKCHPGRGLVPSEKISEEQLENIDCLTCHASGYRRGLYKDKDGKLAWRPILWKNRVGLDSVSKRISLPTRTMCLRCHAGSGGGPNFKRGDVEYKLTDCDSNFDVHMAKDGNDMQCIDCHAGKDHKIPGSGADIAGNEMPTKKVACNSEDCHGNAPHEAEILNIHAKKVYCTVCHIPEFAKADATNMVRDWSKDHFSEKKGKYTYTGVWQKDVKPVYRWYNGTSYMQLPGKKVRLDAQGEIMVAVPQGSRKDPKAKIFAFKEYHAVMPVLNGRGWILPIETGYFYVTGDMKGAVQRASKKFYGIDDAQFTWKKTVRYQGIFHEVQPAKNALQCLDCHGPNGRMDWKALGYNGDPMLAMVKASH